MPTPHHVRRTAHRPRLVGISWVGFLLLLSTTPALGLAPESPEVRKLIDQGAAFLDAEGAGQIQRRPKGDRLGAQCAAGLAMLKAGRKDHPHIQKAIQACRDEISKVGSANRRYGHGLAIIFLCEAAPTTERELIRKYLSHLYQKQKQNGGWGYSSDSIGDTSQTQYMALGLWEAHTQGFRVERDTTTELIDWLLKTQDPSGTWGYKGRIGKENKRIEQQDTSCTMATAALSSLMIAADLFGVLQSGTTTGGLESLTATGTLPSGVKLVREEEDRADAPTKLNPAGIDWKDTFRAMQEGDRWMQSNFVIAANRYPYYYLYTLERYESFLEYRESLTLDSPDWYNKGYEFLVKSQRKSGGWKGSCGEEVDTAFAMLFLLRSTQKSIRRRIGEGAMQSGRGLPSRLAGARLRGGKVIGQSDSVGIEQFLSLVDQEQGDRLDLLADDPSSLVAGDLTEEAQQRLRSLLRSGKPDARLVAVRALGSVGDLNNTPALLYALTDPDRRVVIAARDGLRLTSRRPHGFGLPDAFTDNERYNALESWKQWYLDLRPGELIDLE